MLDTPRFVRTLPGSAGHSTNPDKPRPRAPGAGARAVLFGYLLRSGANDKAEVILDRLETEAVAKLVALLDGEELRQMANLCFSEARVGRSVALDVPALARLCAAGDLDDVERCLRRLPTEIVYRVLLTLPDDRRRALERSIDRNPSRTHGGGPTGQRAERFWAALRLRRLFQR